MKRQCMTAALLGLLCISAAQGYLVNQFDYPVDYWAGAGENECLIVIDWNATNGPYASAFHIFGYRWDAPETTVKDALAALDAAGSLAFTFAYGGGFIGDIVYDRTAADGDYHFAGNTYFGWWWAGQTTDGGLTWQGNEGGVDQKLLRNGGIEGLNIDGFNWGSENMTIPEPASLILLGLGSVAVRRFRKA